MLDQKVTWLGSEVKPVKSGNLISFRLFTKKGSQYNGERGAAHIPAKLFGCSLINLPDMFYSVRVMEGRQVEVSVLAWRNGEYKISYCGHKYWAADHCVAVDPPYAEAIASWINLSQRQAI